MYCDNCGEKIEPNYRYCIECGKKVNPINHAKDKKELRNPFRCVYCGKIKDKSGSNVCNRCYSMIEEHSLELKQNINMFQNQLEYEKDIHQAIIKTEKLLTCYKTLYDYADILPNEIVLKPKNYNQLETKILSELKTLINTKLVFMINNIKHRKQSKLEEELKITRDNMNYFKEAYPMFKEVLDTKLIDDFIGKEEFEPVKENEKFLNETNIDNMNGLDFEEFIANLLIKLNYKDVKKTPASGDFGVDVLAEKNGVKYAIQCKNYSSDLGSKPIQEIIAGKNYYNCHVGVVVTNRGFTSHAVELAKKNNVLLWDRDKLIKMINK